MDARYPATYRDRFGEVQTTIFNDGRLLRMELRGVVFSGAWFDDWEPEGAPNPALLAAFAFQRTDLCNFVLEWTMQLPLVEDGERIAAELYGRLLLGGPAPNGGLDCEEFTFELVTPQRTYRTAPHGYFDDALHELRALLPASTYLKCCHSCEWGDYPVAGYPAFGGLLCFRSVKQEYLAARDEKRTYIPLYQRAAETVQETYLCPEFTFRRST